MGPEPDPTSSVPGMHIWGWMMPVELNWLADRAVGMSSVAEIGCLHGRSAFALLTACPGTVYCVDPWNDDYDKSYPSFLGYCGHFPNLVAIRDFSPLADTPDVEMCFIDGAHSYESVLADIAAWLPHTAKLICGHDYAPDPADAGYPGVPLAVAKVFGDRVQQAPDTSIWYVDLTESRAVEPDLPSGPFEVRDEYGRVSTVNLSW